MAEPADITVRFQDAWNAHDMAAFGRLFHADVAQPKSSFSRSSTRRPREAASHADPAPLQPPPTTMTSKGVSNSASARARWCSKVVRVIAFSLRSASDPGYCSAR